MDLCGTWLALPATEELRRAAVEPGHDDAGWEPVPVPGHWRSVPAFAESDGPLLHRRRFTHPVLEPGERGWLVLDGVFYQSDVWLDGAYVGDTEGYFAPHELEITAGLSDRTEHVLAVDVACPRPDDLTAKRALTGVFQHWDCLDPDGNPGGIWRPVRIERTGSVRIRRLRMVCREATEQRAVLGIEAELDASTPLTAALHTRAERLGERAAERTTDQPLAAGTNVVRWTMPVPQPARWWPWSLGDQPRYEVTVAVSVDGDESHSVTRRTGLRQVQLRNWILSVNGERLFVKGSNQGPARADLGAASAEELARDVVLAREANLDLLRLHAHVTRPEVYEAADAAGLLLWQDLPLQWGYARSVRRQAVEQARRAVDLLGHHPSVALWCAHNEPLALPHDPAHPVEPRRTALRYLAGQQLPTWNRSVLDRSLRRALERADGTRPVIPHSGVLPHLPSLDGTDSHLYFGWYHGEMRDLPRALAAFPRLARFVSEFGAQALPDTADFCEPERWPDLDWARLERTHGLQRHGFARHVPPDHFPTFAAWRDATQRYQADLVKLHVETLRRLKYRPTGGFAQFLFADSHPAVSWSVLDHQRVPKRAFGALADACRPVIVVADWLPATVRPGDTLALDVHVVSDLRHEVTDAQVTARLAWPGGAHVWHFGGDAPPDSCVRVGTLPLVVPEAHGALTLHLLLRGEGLDVSNAYGSKIVNSDGGDGNMPP